MTAKDTNTTEKQSIEEAPVSRSDNDVEVNAMFNDKRAAYKKKGSVLELRTKYRECKKEIIANKVMYARDRTATYDCIANNEHMEVMAHISSVATSSPVSTLYLATSCGTLSSAFLIIPEYENLVLKRMLNTKENKKIATDIIAGRRIFFASVTEDTPETEAFEAPVRDLA